jgi:hypothetical protein
MPPDVDSPAFAVSEIPFSARGSWLDLSPVVGLHRHADDVHVVSHQNGMHAVLALVPQVAGTRVAMTLVATPAVLRWNSASGTIEATFDGTDAVRLRGYGLSLRIGDASGSLTPFTGTYLFTEPGTSSAVFTSYETGRRYRVTPIKGDLSVEGDGQLGTVAREVVVTGREWEIAIEEFETARHPFDGSRTFESLVEINSRAFRDYLDAIAPWRSDETPGAALAAYVLWSATVSPMGYLGRESILMSKHWMD